MTAADPAMTGMTLVDADEPVFGRPQELMNTEQTVELELVRRTNPVAQPIVDISNLKLAAENLHRANEVRVAFDSAAEDCAVGERLLRELVAGETAVALELQDVEAAVVVCSATASPTPPTPRQSRGRCATWSPSATASERGWRTRWARPKT